MAWINDRGVQRWDDEPFPEPCDDELETYMRRSRVPLGPPEACGDSRGTVRGYKRHRRASESTCEDCRGAQNEASRLSKRNRRVPCPDCGKHIAPSRTTCIQCLHTRRNIARNQERKAA